MCLLAGAIGEKTLFEFECVENTQKIAENPISFIGICRRIYPCFKDEKPRSDLIKELSEANIFTLFFKIIVYRNT